MYDDAINDVTWWCRWCCMCIIIRIKRINYLKNDLKTFYSCSNFCHMPKRPKNVLVTLRSKLMTSLPVIRTSQNFTKCVEMKTSSSVWLKSGKLRKQQQQNKFDKVKNVKKCVWQRGGGFQNPPSYLQTPEKFMS